MSTLTAGTVNATASVNTAAINGGQLAGFRNKIIDGGFTINQRGYSSGTTLSAGSYGHDRWKAGASGGDYSFTQLASNTTITIASGKTLIQVIEDKNVEGGSYVLSWTGTAQARYGVDSATPSGSYASSPVTISGQSAGTVMSVEFNEGTLGSVQLEIGDTATPFEQRGIGTELALCQRYYGKSTQAVWTGYPSSGGFQAAYGAFPAQMRASPTFTTTDLGGGGSKISQSADVDGFVVVYGSLGSGSSGQFSYTASAEL